MDNEEPTGDYSNRPIDDWNRHDDACAAFEQSLNRGDSPQIEAYLESFEGRRRLELLHDLLALELEHFSHNGSAPSLGEYRGRFPEDARMVKYVYWEHYAPAQIGEFSIQRLLGRGSYGCVYQAWDAKLSRPVAIKVFRRNIASKGKGRGLLVEARAAAQLRHPGVVAVHAVTADEDGDEFLVLEYVDGRSLDELLRAERVTARQAAEIVLAVTQALQHAHQQGLVHRDLKPGNILIDQERRPRVTDFGFALERTAARRAGEIAGTLAYMAPEQASGETHRIDARTDLWAVGVILYRMLSGRLPFPGTHQELLDSILYTEPESLADCEPPPPAELIAIVQRCLAKRMSDRYQSAAELIEDLQAFLSPPAAAAEASKTPDAVPTELAPVIPKGLRCFDASDREFFLRLVPGPRDRHGIPKSVRYWVQQLGETGGGQPLPVGLLYGPSGCGKSSLVRAGVLPRLPAHVKSIIIEATRDNTELALLRELRRAFPGIPADFPIAEALRRLRIGEWLPVNHKFVLLFDQFEQWLHGWNQNEAVSLVEALRQCDGVRVQAMILVRDDFWMPATRFFQQLDVSLVEGFNAAPVDLFDRAHSLKVLEAFGVSYGRLDPSPSARTDEQKRFLERAVDQLAEGGCVVPVRLCLFAEMVKGRPWVPATLAAVGGAQGLGAAFLEEAFDGRAASPMHRLHKRAARQVLERLLPPPGTNIRGHLVSERDLQAASGYEGRLEDFAALVRCLDHELRLITPSDDPSAVEHPGPAATSGADRVRLYQLTHDFLVTAIRAWLSETRRRTLRGRADLKLAELADAYSARPEARNLPTWFEWVQLALFSRRDRRPSEQILMRAATHRHAWRSAVVIAVIASVGLLTYDRMSAVRADGLVQALLTSSPQDLPRVASRLAEYQRWTQPRLMEQRAADGDVSRQTRVQLGLLAVGDADVAGLDARLLDSDPAMSLAIADLLDRHGRLQGLAPSLWSVAADPQAEPGKRLRACSALARLRPDLHADQWQKIAEPLSLQLLRELDASPQDFPVWVEALRPARQWLVEPLKRSFANPAGSDNDRYLSATILVRYLADDPGDLCELAMESTPRQYQALAKALTPHDAVVRSAATRENGMAAAADLSEDEKDRIALRRANAILLLRQTGDESHLWPALKHSPEPRLRSWLLHQFNSMATSADSWIERLKTEPDPGIRQAIVLLLGDDASIASVPGVNVIETLLKVYREDPDSGVHGASDWTLRRLGRGEALRKATDELAQLGMRKGFDWYVTKSRLTMVIFETPGEVPFGSPVSEPGRDAKDETQWPGDVDWSFAVSATEITQRQLRDLMGKDFVEFLNDLAPSEDCPANAVTWLSAMEYCRRLSKEDGLPETEWLPPPQKVEAEGFPDARKQTGYRLPLEMEWEVACRAGTTTARFFGYAPNLLDSYGCYIGNSAGRTKPVGSFMPNPKGLFDMLGNVSEWCYDLYLPNRHQHPLGVMGPFRFSLQYNFPVRGNGYVDPARMIRAANRSNARPDHLSYGRGCRVAHTIRHETNSK